MPWNEHSQPLTFPKPEQSQPSSKTLQAGTSSPEGSVCQGRSAHSQTNSTSTPAPQEQPGPPPPPISKEG